MGVRGNKRKAGYPCRFHPRLHRGSTFLDSHLRGNDMQTDNSLFSDYLGHCPYGANFLKKGDKYVTARWVMERGAQGKRILALMLMDSVHRGQDATRSYARRRD